MISRRQLLTALGASALVAPFASLAQQQGKVWRVGFLWERGQLDADSVKRFEAYKTGMRELGYTDGAGYTTEHRSAQSDLARLPALTAELLALKVDVIVVSGTPAAVAAHNVTRATPILITLVGDPIGNGLAESFRRPGRNVTGLTNLGSELYSKRLDLLRQMLPGIRRVGFIYNPADTGNTRALMQFEADCAKLGFKSIRASVRKPDDIAAAFNTLISEKTQGLIVTGGTNYAWRSSIFELAGKHRLPAIYASSIFAEAGGLISYAPDNADLYRRSAAYADKIFKGVKPSDLPIEQPTLFEMVLNMKTAKALGLKIPNSILAQATKVIE